MPRPAPSLACLGLLAMLLATGCDASDDPVPADPLAGYGDAACASIAAECRKQQRGCTMEEGTPTCAMCPEGYFPVEPLGACEALPGERWVHTFNTYDLQPGEEIGSLCRSWVLNNDDPLYINAVEFKTNGGYHHSNWFFVPEDYKNWSTEPWLDCYGDGFNEVEAALAGGVIFAQSTQSLRELQKFREGVVVRIPPRSRLITATHLLNITPEPITSELQLSLQALDPNDVQTALTPFQLIYTPLHIPPQSESMFESSCDIKTTFKDLKGQDEPFDMKLHYLLPHYHALGTELQVEILGGPNDGMQLLDRGKYSPDPGGVLFDPPIDMRDADGLTFRCGYNNPTDEVVKWGIGDQEMCEALGFMESSMAFTAGPNENSVLGVINGDGVVWNEGACRVTGFPFDPGL